MCGVFGVLTNLPRKFDQVSSDLVIGLETIRHRGPDGTGTWVAVDGRVGLGHVRLAIIDLESGAQPMHSDDGRYTIIYNGEIYNYVDLRAELGVGTFRTHSDTEVVLRAFQKWGADCVTRFRGMFAMAIWDATDQKLLIARDRFGIKPLYWAQTPGGFYFASEIKALLPFLKERAVNPAALADYFTFQFCLGEKTLMDGVWQLPAAHFAFVSSGQAPRLKRYWEVHYDLDYDHTESWFTRCLRDLLEDSVRVHLRADVEVGGYVSGGVDSSLLAALAREVRPSGPFKAFNGRFLDGIDFDESAYAKSLADERSMELFVADIGEQDFVDHIARVIWHLDQPAAGPGSFPQYMVAKEVGRHIKVVLGGQGGDEIFGGYARYLVAYFEQCIKGAIEGSLHNGNYVVTYESIIPNLESLRQYKPMLREFWAGGLFGERDERYWRLVNRANTFGTIIAPELLDQRSTFEEFRSIFWGSNVGKESYFDSMTHFDFKTLLPALLQVEDRMSMAHGVEARVPFLDHPLVEFAATIPADIKFRNGELKRLLKAVFADRLPASIRERRDKMGFPVPLNLWLKRPGPTRELIGDLFASQAARSRPYLNGPLSIDAVLDTQSTYGRNLWALLSLELWHQQFID
ncbi:MAG: asparagine synthase (glutamine-hydrolyzing) [Accumulibacter sp.]|jgi:asparagine synthase (glutamine-hydrolysing)